MKILYVARHNQTNSNDDEGAIAHALRQLGHEVRCIPEESGFRVLRERADLVLFHKWADWRTLKRSEGRMRRVFWYFDLVDFPDPTLERRCRQRKDWMRTLMPHVEVGFCTDGDWVAQHPDKLAWLPQGADERVIGFGEKQDRLLPIVFVGTQHGGQARESFVKELSERYRTQFFHIPTKIHGRKLADLIARTQIVVAPDGPVTDRYWSNRLYLMTGYGAFLLHPYSRTAREHYQDGQEVVFYENREQLHNQIELFLGDEKKRESISQAALERTKREHLYRHRCEELIRKVESL